MKRLAIIIFAGAIVAAGCAQLSPQGPQTAATTAPAPSAAELRAAMNLDQIVLPPFPSYPRPTTQPGPAPIEALQIYAHAMDLLADNQPYRAVLLLQKAIEIDPYSYQLYMAMARAQLERTGRPNELALDALEHAVALDPEDADARLLLGESYLKNGDGPRAIEQLRQAVRTSGYRRDEVVAARVDFDLSMALTHEGYEQAALDRYLLLLDRIANPGYQLQADPVIRTLIFEPQRIWTPVGLLYERRGKLVPAIEIFESLSRLEPSRFDLQAKVVRLLLAMGRNDEATRRAADIVMRFRASSESIALMREVYQKLGKPDATIAELQRLHAEAPGDHGILFAYADALDEQNRPSEAIALLEAARKDHPDDQAVFEKLFDAYRRRDAVESAAGLLMSEASAHPDSFAELLGQWNQLIAPLRKNPLRLEELRTLQAPPGAEAVKLLLVARLADMRGRYGLARNSLEEAVKLNPPYGPAYRDMSVEIWSRADWDQTAKVQAEDGLARAADAAGAAGLAEEIRGITDYQRHDITEAVRHFAAAIAQGDVSPSLQLDYAIALNRAGQPSRSEQLLWKLVSDHPSDSAAWSTLYENLLNAGSERDAAVALDKWLASDPGSADARLTEVDLLIRNNELSDAESRLLKLLEDHPDDDRVLLAAQAFYNDVHRPDDFIKHLEDIRAEQPRNLNVGALLAELYTRANRTEDASRVLQAARDAVAGEPDLLYTVSQLYDQLGQKPVAEEILQEVVKLDPGQAAACNDLGYAWADEGRNIDRAESLIRNAVGAEPDNQAFLDSMAWVLYKQGKFDEAATYMKQALDPADAADPVLLNHFGDILYRQGKQEQAIDSWNKSLSRLQGMSSDRPDLRDLLPQLLGKINQAKTGRPVTVAPIVESAAKN